MKYLKWAGGILLGLALLFIIIGLLLPRRYHIERSVTINAPPPRIFPFVNRLPDWQKWTPWNVERYPDMQVKYSGPEEGVGAHYEWDGASTGHGELKLTSSDPESGVTYDMAFNHGEMPCTGGLKFAPEGTTTKVTWFMDGDLGFSPINRYCGLILDSMVGSDFDTGLANLKTQAEAAPADNQPGEATPTDLNPRESPPSETSPKE